MLLSSKGNVNKPSGFSLSPRFYVTYSAPDMEWR